MLTQERLVREMANFSYMSAGRLIELSMGHFNDGKFYREEIKLNRKKYSRAGEIV